MSDDLAPCSFTGCFRLDGLVGLQLVFHPAQTQSSAHILESLNTDSAHIWAFHRYCRIGGCRFFLTSHPWLFLFFTLVFWGYCGHKRKTAAPGHIMPVLTEDGVKLESFSTEELLKDIRAQKRETAQKSSQAKED